MDSGSLIASGTFNSSMIVTIILYLLYGVIYLISAPLRLLSDVSIPAGLSSAISTGSGYLASVGTFIPVDTILQVLAAMLVVEAGVLTYRLVVWVITKIPGISN